MAGYGASFRRDLADVRALIFKNTWTKISYAGRVTIDGRPTLRYTYDNLRGALAVALPPSAGRKLFFQLKAIVDLRVEPAE